MNLAKLIGSLKKLNELRSARGITDKTLLWGAFWIFVVVGVTVGYTNAYLEYRADQARQEEYKRYHNRLAGFWVVDHIVNKEGKKRKSEGDGAGFHITKTELAAFPPGEYRNYRVTGLNKGIATVQDGQNTWHMEHTKKGKRHYLRWHYNGDVYVCRHSKKGLASVKKRHKKRQLAKEKKEKAQREIEKVKLATQVRSWKKNGIIGERISKTRKALETVYEVEADPAGRAVKLTKKGVGVWTYLILNKDEIAGVWLVSPTGSDKALSVGEVQRVLLDLVAQDVPSRHLKRKGKWIKRTKRKVGKHKASFGWYDNDLLEVSIGKAPL